MCDSENGIGSKIPVRKQHFVAFALNLYCLNFSAFSKNCMIKYRQAHQCKGAKLIENKTLQNDHREIIEK